MMDAVPALKAAIDLVHFPSQVRQACALPVPNGIEFVLRIVAGDDEVVRLAADATGRAADEVKDAAEFFVEQILLFPEADSYRVLGATPNASASELRRNMALLLRWLHPDYDRKGERSVFAARVTRAWEDLKTKERRDAYDAQRTKSVREPQDDVSKHRARQHRKGRRRNLVVRGQSGRSLKIYDPKPPSLIRRIFWALIDKAKL